MFQLFRRFQHAPRLRYLSARDAAQQMGIPVEIVRSLCRKGVLPGSFQRKENGPWYIPQQDVTAWIETPTFESRVPGWTSTNYSSGNLFKLFGKIIGYMVTLISILTVVSIIADFGNARQQLADWGIYYPIAKEREGEILIVVANFNSSDNLPNTEIHKEIYKAIQSAINDLKFTSNKLRVEIIPMRLDEDDKNGAESIGKRYNAHVVIWGGDTGVRVTVNFLNRKSPINIIPIINYQERIGDSLPSSETLESINDTEKSQIGNPRQYTQLITEDLPGQLTFLSLYAIGQSFYPSEPEKCISTLNAGLQSYPDNKLQSRIVANTFFWLGMCSLEEGDFEDAIKNFELAIHNYPEYPLYYIAAAYVLAMQGDIENSFLNMLAANKILISSDNQDIFTDYGRNTVLGVNYSALGSARIAIAERRAFDSTGFISYENAKLSDPSINYLQYSEKYYSIYKDDLLLGRSELIKGTDFVYSYFIDDGMLDKREAFVLSSSYEKIFFASMEVGDVQYALQIANHIYEIAPLYFDVYKLKGIAYEALGQLDMAIVNYEIYLAANPYAKDNILYKATIQYLETQNNKP